MNAAQQKYIERAKAWAAQQLAERNRMMRVGLEIDIDHIDGATVNDLVAWARDICDRVPAEYRASSKLEVEYGCSVMITGYYIRPETDAERDADKPYQDLKAIAEKGTRE